ncbi:MAG: hypothetical protein HYV40_05525 [Candidatus Levybacteria bacterium]|nr:hypothetical protein [Candidatus Levybacteria bacterium]
MQRFVLTILFLSVAFLVFSQDEQKASAQTPSPTPTFTPTPTPCGLSRCPTPTGPTRTPTPSPTISPDWVLVGIHPDASIETTALAKQLQTLIAWNGRIYSGYGDYTSNTGPVTIRSFDPATKVFTQEWISDTEAISNYRIIRGKLYAPAIDRKINADYAVGEIGKPWKDVSIPSTTSHAFDMVTLTGSDLWLVGALGFNACAWRSLDDGVTWSQSLCIPKVTTYASDFARFYFAGVFKGKLYVQGRDFYSGAHPTSKVFDPGTSTWSDGPSLLPLDGVGWRPIEFAEKLIYRIHEGYGTVTAFDGTSYSFVPNPVGAAEFSAQDIIQDGDALYVLTSSEIMKTADLVNWTVVVPTVPFTAQSLAILDGKFYIGTTDSKIYVYNPSGIPSPTPTPLTGDINKDGKVDLLDFNIWRDEFLGDVTTKQSDLNSDGKVDLLDFNIWLSAYKAG